MTLDPVEAALQDLLADRDRTGSSIDYDGINSTALRHRLSADASALLAMRARAAGIVDEEEPSRLTTDLATSTGQTPDLGDTPLLSALDEKNLARAIEQGSQASERLLAGDYLDPVVQAELLRLVTSGHRARERFILANTRLVLRIARQHFGRGLEYDDLVQEGLLGLFQAVDRFDWRLGFKFSTYATWWIRQGMERAIMNQGRTIRLPVHVGERIRKLKRAEERLNIDLGRPPSHQELADAIDSDVAEVAFLYDAGLVALSLDRSVDGLVSLGELLPDRRRSTEAEVETLLAGDEARELLEIVTPRERDVLERRYGMHDGSEWTLDRIGRLYGLTRERVRQIQAKAEKRLRRHLVRAGRLPPEESE